MSRTCARPGCNGTATATLSYDYAGRVAELHLLADERHPMSHDLCTPHADKLSVPRGWERRDRRVVSSLPQRFDGESAGADLRPALSVLGGGAVMSPAAAPHRISSVG